MVVVSYGITSRVAQRAIEMARKKGLKVGKFRLITAWPFPEKQIAEIAAKVKAIVVAELNLGQMVREVERAAAGKAIVRLVGHAGGSVHRRKTFCRPSWRWRDERRMVTIQNPVEQFLRMDRIPHIWCPGCGIGTSVNSFANALIDAKVDTEEPGHRLRHRLHRPRRRIHRSWIRSTPRTAARFLSPPA